jgi:hypothetical protein
MLKQLASSAMDMVKKVAPDLIGLVPGVGPAAKLLLTTLNDDEWFGEFTGAGVTANEFLCMKSYARNGHYMATAAIAEVRTRINASSEFTDNFMPMVLAYVRNHTNNVLVDDVSLYTQAFINGSALYALYYEGMKYIRLSEHQPLNIPLLSDTIKAIDPRIYSAFKGSVEALGDFLKTTVRLPYAWVSYIRWRYGTTFYSENTGKPGLILYNYTNGVKSSNVDPQVFLTDYNANIAGAKAGYIAAGRAGADLKLAYDNHQITYDVEGAHHDAKEFNLRTNLDFGTDPAMHKEPAAKGNAFVFIDSRLDQSAAIQAVTISTPTGINPFYCDDMHISLYFAEPVTMKYGYIKGHGGNPSMMDKEVRELTTNVGWYAFRPINFTASRDSLRSEELDQRFPVIYAKDEEVSGHTVSTGRLTEGWVFHSGIGAGMIPIEGVDLPGGSDSVVFTSPLDNAFVAEFNAEGDSSSTAFKGMVFSAILTAYFSLPMLTALQFHNTGLLQNAGLLGLAATPLAYDMAYVSIDQLKNIQRTAIRNLVRGDYRAKIQPAQRPELKDAIAKVETTALADIKEHL